MILAAVGGAFLNASVKILLDKLISPEFRDYFTNAKLNESLMEQIETTLLFLEIVLDDAEKKQTHKPRIKQWLDRLKDVIFDAEDLLNQISYNTLLCNMEKNKTFLGRLKDKIHNIVPTPYSIDDINSEMDKICKKLQTLVQQSTILGLKLKKPTSTISHRTPSSSDVNISIMVGRNGDRDKLVKMLTSDRSTDREKKLGVVAIFGMGGVGKTALAQFVFQDNHVQSYFDIKVWVCVSQDFDIFRVTKFLLESAARNTNSVSSNVQESVTLGNVPGESAARNTNSVSSKVWESDNLDILRGELKKICNKNKCLFVLDDLWNDSYNDWDELVSPLIDGKPGNSVIITTRHENVAKMAGTLPIHELKPLSDEDCWSLLSMHALGPGKVKIDENKDLEETGRKIAKKCGGLPIVAKSLGQLLHLNVDTKAWTTILGSDVWKLPNDNIIPALHLSYQYLPSHLKRCFAYLSIFPKGFPLDRKKLILLWMAEGFLDCYEGGKSAEQFGDDCFVELLSRSLIQQSNDNARGKIFFMHDLFHDLATVVSGKSCCRIKCGDISKNVRHSSQNVRHISYNQELFDIFKKFENINNFKLLRSFLSPARCYSKSHISIKVIEEFLPTLQSLHVLSLSNYAITELPAAIGDLRQLRYLDLSYTKIKRLPDTTCNLYNLQTLILSRCTDLTKLPVHMGNLINLCHLDITDTNIKELPMEIARLENLQTLTVFIVGQQKEGLSIKELRKFTNLQGKLTIKDLHNVIDATEAEDANLKSKEKIEELELLWGKQSDNSKDVELVFQMLQPPINLKSLNIGLYSGISFPSWMGNSSFSNLVSLRINNCDNCMKLPPLGQLPSLKDLEIHGMKILETIGPEFCCAQGGECSNSSFQPFPSLERIKFDSMPSWKEWIHFEGTKYAFPKLKTMKLHNCPELRGLPSHLSCIEEIVIKDCPHLLETRSTSHGSEKDESTVDPPPEKSGLETASTSQGTENDGSRGVQWFSSLKKLEMNGPAEGKEQDGAIIREPPSYVPKFIEGCSARLLQHLKLSSLSSLATFPPSGLPTSLKSLCISKCENLSFLPSDTWSSYTSLLSLELESSCDALKSFQLDGFPVLQRLDIYKCNHLNSICISKSRSPRPSNLRSLSVTCGANCSLKVELKMDALTALENLTLNCEAELSFSDGVCLPPKLQSMTYINKNGRNPTHVRDWGFRGLTGLFGLTIQAEDVIVSTLMKESLLPTSLKVLIIGNKEMETFDVSGLQHLSSLKHLRIVQCEMLKSLPRDLRLLSSLNLLQFLNCPALESLPGNCLPSSLENLVIKMCEKLKSLPEDNLPGSLEVMVIEKCPLLEERYGSKEDLRSQLAHIPVIRKNDQVTVW
ncbi:unnamed protein product [Trifolium pratense]|uniref:Uncharacterized protein n=1 Tax=Trifolium pratense TaxID=57577 RepID=A0ACB0J4M7_TRIPR|nr:unnamed protein product [Trifolium pratense]